MLSPYRYKYLEREPHIRTWQGRLHSLNRRFRCLSSKCQTIWFNILWILFDVSLGVRGTLSGGPG